MFLFDIGIIFLLILENIFEYIFSLEIFELFLLQLFRDIIYFL